MAIPIHPVQIAELLAIKRTFQEISVEFFGKPRVQSIEEIIATPEHQVSPPRLSPQQWERLRVNILLLDRSLERIQNDLKPLSTSSGRWPLSEALEELSKRPELLREIELQKALEPERFRKSRLAAFERDCIRTDSLAKSPKSSAKNQS